MSGQRADKGRLQCDLMYKIWLQLPVQCPDLPDDVRKVQRVDATSAPIERMQMEPLPLNFSARTVQMRGYMHLVPGITRCTRHRQPM